MNLECIGVVGLGTVGRAITKRLLEAGLIVSVYGEEAGGAAECVEMGAQWAAIPADVAVSAQVVMLMIEDDAAAEEALFGLGGVGETLCSNGYILDGFARCETMKDAWACQLSKFGITWVDVSPWLFNDLVDVA